MDKQTLHTIDLDWYNRLHRLREVWQDESETDDRRDKARHLWAEMSGRLIVFSNRYTAAMNSRFASQFNKGGFETI